ncbi:CDP-diacylglycerol--glycerol-3-phosphate 3-phosphatidyltransferase [Miniphocaeibacter halophilus]|uniref:CDP-diacylglycerol--glycerol-3-phosphate 3-phosphatidyltransferase n=1 Tax=Miniphocaeibacter halophilus TaxID=2931922 RepID=A0AC61MQ38_9FIRM|nr:CDP-diacylglycerol--glycerol-3-phosphate 3-phosphatidyltransferase [Miniphocaeibacter halophilus]QQK07622.1 CDP-diacylglycerol--glycerol-3-phosphate 3-phosphatidyltransferase [Miniphocaeibacter halophilus]
MNIANKFTIFRLILIPVFIILLMVLGIDSLIPGLVFVIASLTDFIDGHLARSRNLVTTFGKFLDPLADKMLVTAALIMFIELGLIPAWTVCIVVAREFIITGFRVLAASNGITIAASFWGKFKTVSQFLAIIMILFSGSILFWIPTFIISIVYYISVILTIISGIDYLIKNIHVLDLDNI